MPDDYLKLVPPWHLDEAQEIAKTRIFRLMQRRGTSPIDPAKQGDFVYLDTADWVNVIALTPDKQIVLIEQFRHGTAEVTLEIPGGIVDPGEDPLTTCHRELLEETGYAADNGKIIGVVTGNPAMLNNRVHTALIENVTADSEQQLDGLEEIAVRLVPLEDVPSLIQSGLIHHSLVVAAFAHFILRGQ